MDLQPNQSHTGHSKDTGSVAEMLKAYLMEEARERTIRRAVVGGRFCAVVLDNDSAGAVNICSDACRQQSLRQSGSPPTPDWLPRAGTPAADVLANLGSPTQSAIGLATANALANRSCRQGGRWDETGIGGDLLDVLELKPDDHVGMVGCFSPLLEPIRRRVRRLSIFERAPRLVPGALHEDQAYEMLPTCSVALITATTVANGTIDPLLAATSACREVVLLGPSTPLMPEVFVGSPRRATLLSGVVVTDPDDLLRTVAQGGGTRDFKASVAKVNVRVDPSWTPGVTSGRIQASGIGGGP